MKRLILLLAATGLLAGTAWAEEMLYGIKVTPALVYLDAGSGAEVMVGDAYLILNEEEDGYAQVGEVVVVRVDAEFCIAEIVYVKEGQGIEVLQRAVSRADWEEMGTAAQPMEEMGVHHLNLHQLLASPYNYKALAQRNYTFLHQNPVPVLESEMTVLQLLFEAAENGHKLPINYCSGSYKSRVQIGRAGRMRAAPIFKTASESLTESGMFARLAFRANRRCCRILQRNYLKRKAENLSPSRPGYFMYPYPFGICGSPEFTS